nr:MAG TPA: hypothetical protein [Caudoviricetes sp.]
MRRRPGGHGPCGCNGCTAIWTPVGWSASMRKRSGSCALMRAA